MPDDGGKSTNFSERFFFFFQAKAVTLFSWRSVFPSKEDLNKRADFTRCRSTELFLSIFLSSCAKWSHLARKLCFLFCLAWLHV
jgi:hypothetical protein